MFKYVNDISNISHFIIKNYCSSFNVAIDCTLGNGYDTDFLRDNFKKVYAFDIQKEAVDQYKSKNINLENVFLINDSHEKINLFVEDKVDCIMYNLGFLPGGNKKITTKAYSTLESVKAGISLLNYGGIITVAIYTGHEEGKKEEIVLLDYLTNLPKKDYGVLLHTFLNRENNPPLLAIIEKNKIGG